MSSPFDFTYLCFCSCSYSYFCYLIFCYLRLLVAKIYSPPKLSDSLCWFYVFCDQIHEPRLTDSQCCLRNYGLKKSHVPYSSYRESFSCCFRFEYLFLFSQTSFWEQTFYRSFWSTRVSPLRQIFCFYVKKHFHGGSCCVISRFLLTFSLSSKVSIYHWNLQGNCSLANDRHYLFSES